MLKIMEFILLGASVLVIAGLIIAGPKSAPPADDEAPLGSATPHPHDHENGGHTVTH